MSLFFLYRGLSLTFVLIKQINMVKSSASISAELSALKLVAHEIVLEIMHRLGKPVYNNPDVEPTGDCIVMNDNSLYLIDLESTIGKIYVEHGVGWPTVKIDVYYMDEDDTKHEKLVDQNIDDIIMVIKFLEKVEKKKA